MAALAWSTTLQDRVALALFNAQYSTLTTAQKLLIDGNSSSNPPTTGVAADMFRAVQRWAQWIEIAGTIAASTAATDAATALLVAKVIYGMALTVRPERIPEFKQAVKDAEENYFDTIARTEITNGYTAGDYTLNLQSIRYYVLGHTFRRKERLVVPPEDIDAATRWIVSWLWNSRRWNFRRRSVTMTVTTTTDGDSPTFDLPSGETFDGLATRNLYYVGTERDRVSLADADSMSAYRSETENSAPGKPRFFRIERQGNTFKWGWVPVPDQTYTFKGEVLIALPGSSTPGVPTSATDTTVFAKFPREFEPLIKELVCGRVLLNRGVTEDVWKAAVDEVERRATDYDDLGNADQDQSVRDYYGDIGEQWNRRDGLGGVLL